MNGFAVIAYFKNEAHILKEWIMHYFAIGAEHIYLIDNGSDDDYGRALDGYQSDITLINGPELSQIAAYRHAYTLARPHHQWVAFLDLDEFLYPKDPKVGVSGFLEGVDDRIEAVSIGWKIFVPSLLFQPKSVISGFTEACSRDEVSSCPYKTLFRTSVPIERLNYHCPKGLQRDTRLAIPTSTGPLGLNHYRFQSYEYLLGVKSSRGGGVHKDKYHLHQVRSMIDRYLSGNLEEDKQLLEQSRELVAKIEKSDQIKPRIAHESPSPWHDLLSRKLSCINDHSSRALYQTVIDLLPESH